MQSQDIFNKYYIKDSAIYDIVWSHSQNVATKVLKIIEAHPEITIDKKLAYESALLHDIGVFKTYAPGIHCEGKYPYIMHGVLGAEILNNEGFPKHALVCERHTGTGITLKDIIEHNFPLPHRDMLPISIEEKIVCYADKFFSKSGDMKEKSFDTIRNEMAKFGADSLARFDEMDKIFHIW